MYFLLSFSFRLGSIFLFSFVQGGLRSCEKAFIDIEVEDWVAGRATGAGTVEQLWPLTGIRVPNC